jgi:predicted aspartyl protease
MSQTPGASAENVLESVRQATGGDAWNRFRECESQASITLGGKTGTLRYVEDLRTGANVSYIDIPELGVHQGHGISPAGDWRQDDTGDIQLQQGRDPLEIDEFYLVSHGYWRPHFGGADVKLLSESTEQGTTYDRLEFHVPGGHGFTLWIDHSTHLIQRVITDSERYFGDYRPVNGVLLPFFQRNGQGAQTQSVVMTKRVLLRSLNVSAFAIPFRSDYTMPSSGRVTVPAEGGINFEGKINGKGPYRMMFDTGSINLLSADLAKQLGLRLESDSQKFASDSGNLNMQITHVATLQIGGLIVRDQRFFVLSVPAGTTDAPLIAVGYELMRRFAVKIDYERQQLTFYNAPAFSYSGNAVKVPLRLEGQVFEVNASVNGFPGVFFLDTGNESAFTMEAEFVKQNHLVERLGAHYHGYSGKGYAGPTGDAYFARVKTLRIGDAEVHDLIAYLVADQPNPTQTAGNIGRSILRQFNVIFDCLRGNLYLEKNANWGEPGIFSRAGILLDPTEQGQQVMTVLPGSPGEAAGLAVGDIITRIDGKPPGDDPDEPAFLQAEGTVVHITVKHGDTDREMQVTLKNLL